MLITNQSGMVDVAQNNPIVRTLVTLIVVCAAREGIRTNECKHKQHLICSDKTSHLSQNNNDDDDNVCCML